MVLSTREAAFVSWSRNIRLLYDHIVHCRVYRVHHWTVLREVARYPAASYTEFLSNDCF
jgi:hypothetical protein